MSRTALFTMTVLSILVYPGVAQDIVDLDQGAIGTYLKLKQLQTTSSVLHVVAHPDDEDGPLLAYCARGLGARTMLFSITRGEGGANLISSHFFDELGALRTLEHLKAASYYGNQLFYSRGADYGYSKTLQEAMTQWDNGLPMLADLVEVIRREQPTVMVSRFRGDPRDGHGHHQMAGVICRLAFDAAADPAKFPEQLQRGLETWQVTKLYVSAGSPWRTPQPGEWTIKIPTGTFDPLLGKSYAQVARFGLGFQRSQGISGHLGDPGPQSSYYRLEKHHGVATPARDEESLFDSIETSLAGCVAEADPMRPRLADLDRDLHAAFFGWHPRRNGDTAQPLLRLLGELRAVASVESLPAHARRQLTIKEQQLQQAIIHALGLQLEAWVEDDDSPFTHATPNQGLVVHVRLANQGSDDAVELHRLTLQTPDDPVDVASDQTVPAGTVFEGKAQVAVIDAAPTRPHWRRPTIAQPTYDVSWDGQQRPVPPPPLQATAALMIDDQVVHLDGAVEVRYRHPVFGHVRYPLTVAPAMSVAFPLRSGIIPRGNTSYDVAVVVRSSVNGPAQAAIRLNVPRGWACEPEVQQVAFSRADEEVTQHFKLQVPSDAAVQEYTIEAMVEYAGEQYREGFETVTARDLGRLNVYRDAVHRVQVAELALLGQPRVGYIAGSGDQVADSLTPLGVYPQQLSSSDLAAGDLSDFDVILVGVRAYAVRDDIRRYNARLLEYVERGGVLVVQYQTPEFDRNFGPYPYQMGRRPEEVSEEDAPVTILQPDHPLFQLPNRITTKDFDGWLEQRGSKFWQTWDERYIPMLECHDTGQPSQAGGMLVARYGAGVYVYSAYAWYRQLPHGVAGAYRLFANILSLPETLAD